MLFNTLEYGAFLLLVLPVYYLLPHRGQNVFLLLASYLFYGSWDPRFLLLILFSTAVDYWVGLSLAASSDQRRRRLLLLISVLTNLGLLGLFKYAGFFSEGFADLMALFGIEVSRLVLDIVLPVGISFYTFQTMSYTIDIYRGHGKPTRNFADFALFVAFFPQLVAGPIERAVNLLPQILSPREPSWEKIGSGCWLILWGLFKKVVIADNLAFLVDSVYGPGSSPTNIEVVVATYAFFFQLYCDFSGYTNIARGTARLMGFELMVNFNLPIFSTSPADFWNRWHISLGSWIRDYVHIPLGGSRLGLWRTCRNLFVMFVLVGLWHGAAWNFVIWGVWQGISMVLHRLARHPLSLVQPETRSGVLSWLWIRRICTFHWACFSLLLFRATSVDQIGSLILSLFTTPQWGQVVSWLPGMGLILPLLLMEMWQAYRNDQEILLRQSRWVRLPVYTLILLAILLLGEEGEVPFVYFQF